MSDYETDPWLFDELARLRGKLDDAREGYSLAIAGDSGIADENKQHADEYVLDALSIIRGIELAYYGVAGPDREVRSLDGKERAA